MQIDKFLLLSTIVSFTLWASCHDRDQSADLIVINANIWTGDPSNPEAGAMAIQGIYAAVTRHTLDGLNPEGWVPEQKITVEQALKAYTLDAAYASYEELIKGSLEIGKLADFVVLSEDPRVVEPSQLSDINVLYTFVDGHKVFELE